MARLSSLERWSATMMWSANRLVTERNRSRIHASLRTGVTTTTRTGSDTVLRYDGELERETARGAAGCFKSIGWAQYRPADGRAWRFRWRRRRLAAAARRLIPVAQAGWATTGLGRWRHKFWWRLLPHGVVDPARWVAQVAIK